MLAAIGFLEWNTNWVAGNQIGTPLPATLGVGEYTKDINGTQLAVGQTVKLVGVITAIDATDRKFEDITIQPLHPGFAVSVQLKAPKLQGPYKFHPSQLVVGS